MLRRVLAPVFAVALVACGAPNPTPEDVGVTDSSIGAALKKQRAAIIRDAAKAAGFTNPVLVAGVAAHESGGLYFCYGEGLTSCPGPASPDCGGGPILAGYWDGPCANEEGGLGFFQFDAGTYSQTLNAYGSGILSIDGNTKAGAKLIISKVRNSPHTPDFGPFKSPDTAGLANALAWINEIVIDGKNYDTYLTVLAANYNGCTKGCTIENGCNCNHEERKKDYDNGIKSMLAYGDDFWGGSSNGGDDSPPDASGCAVQSDGKLHCANKVDAPMHEDPSAGSAVVNYLRTTPSWFDCWGTGEVHAGGNNTWYHTLGDDNANWGWVPGVYLLTPDSFDANPSTQGLKQCGSSVPALPALPANCNVHADGKLYCDNAAHAAMYKSTNTGSGVVDHLETTASWFKCWGTGEKHAGGNTTWYYTQGDESGSWGYTPGVNLMTPSTFDTDPSAYGFAKCN